jgi:hypothetical protein
MSRPEGCLAGRRAGRPALRVIVRKVGGGNAAGGFLPYQYISEDIGGQDAAPF